MSGEYQRLSLDVSDYVATVRLCRADKANALDLIFWREIGRCFAALDHRDDVRVIILAAEGKHFCSGIDFSVFSDLMATEAEPARRSESLRTFIRSLQADLSAIELCRKPVIAAIQGACVGAGVDMICCADMRYASANAKFSVKEVDLAITADVGTLQRLPKLIPDGVARELAYTARSVDAEEASRIGLINQVFDDEKALLESVRALALSIAKKSPLAIRGTKEMLVYARDHSVVDGLNHVATWNAGMLSIQDVGAALDASIKGESPEFLD